MIIIITIIIIATRVGQQQQQRRCKSRVYGALLVCLLEQQEAHSTFCSIILKTRSEKAKERKLFTCARK